MIVLIAYLQFSSLEIIYCFAGMVFQFFRKSVRLAAGGVLRPRRSSFSPFLNATVVVYIWHPSNYIKAASLRQTFTMAHTVMYPAKNFFYAIGNTSAVVLTDTLASEEPANLLLLGCGDPRNILFTVYNQADDSESCWWGSSEIGLIPQRDRWTSLAAMWNPRFWVSRPAGA